jgi:hypothetical protein
MQEPTLIDSMLTGDITNSELAGYTCSSCLTWVPNGTPHVCLNANQALVEWSRAYPLIIEMKATRDVLNRIADALEAIARKHNAEYPGDPR